MTTLWLLMFIAGHSYGTVPGIASQQECERLFSEMVRTSWAHNNFGENHRCIPYQGH